MEIQANLTVAQEEAEKIAADLRKAEMDAAAGPSWLAQNYPYATAIAVGGLILGVSIGMKLAEHLK